MLKYVFLEILYILSNSILLFICLIIYISRLVDLLEPTPLLRCSCMMGAYTILR